MSNTRRTKVVWGRHTVVCFTAVAAAIASLLLGGRSLHWREKWARAELLDQGRMVARAIPLSQLRALAGTDADLLSPVYSRLKRQLAAAKQLDDRWEWLYLLGRRKDGTVFFFVDSGPADGEDTSPPGQAYEEATPLLRSLFDVRRECVEGPETDRWGTWISPLVSITDPKSGEVVAVLGIDVDAARWQQGIPLLETQLLVLGAILLAMFVMWFYLQGQLFGKACSTRCLDVVGVLAVGSVLTAAFMWLGLAQEDRHRLVSFKGLAGPPTDRVVEEFHDLEDEDLPHLAGLFGGSAWVSERDFSRSVGHLSGNTIVRVWSWAASVRREDRGRVERDLRAGGWARLGIWEKGKDGAAVPALDRERHHPVTYVFPADSAEAVVGFDMGSEPAGLRALRESSRTGLTTATDPLAVIGCAGEGLGFLVSLPVTPPEPSEDGPDAARLPHHGGHLIAVVGESALSRVVASCAVELADGVRTSVGLAQLHASGEPRTVIAGTAAEWESRSPFVHLQPIFAFGKTYVLRTCAMAGGRGLGASGSIWLLGFAGLSATLAVAALVATLAHGRERLQRTVAERTSALRESIDRSNELASYSRVVSWETDAQGLYTHLGQSTEGILGYRPEEWVGKKHYYDPHPEESRKQFIAATRAVFGAKEPFRDLENPVRAKDGHVVWVSSNGVPILGEGGQLLGYRGLDRDITREREARLVEQFQASFNKILAEASASFAVIKDEEFDLATDEILRRVGELLEVDRTYLVLFSAGLATATNTNEWCAEGLAPQRHLIQELPVELYPWWREKLRNGEPLHIPDVAGLPPEADAERRFLAERGTVSMLWLLMRSGEGAVLGFFGMSAIRKERRWEPAEISMLQVLAETMAAFLNRRATARALASSEERYRLLTEGMKDVVWSVDTSTMQYVYVSPAVESMLGYTQSEMLQRGFADFLVPEDRETWPRLVAARVASLHAGREPFGNHYTYEMDVPRKDGSIVRTEVIARYWLNQESGSIELHGVSRDISDRKQAEGERGELQKQLIQAQRMESVGRLAGGVAHDFNNMLQAILGYTEMALAQVTPGGTLHHDIREIQRTVDRSSDLTKQLLAFARRQTVLPKVLNLSDAVVDTLGMLQRLIGEDVRLVWVPEQRLWATKLDPSQISMVLANLCVNARDAIDGVGRVTIETHNVSVDDAYCVAHANAIPGEYVMLTVDDDGCGMEKELLEQIFEPFFTTKDVDKGTGLGLSTVYGIAMQNGGFVNVYSEPGKGTTFRIYFPRYDGELEARPSQPTGDGGRGGHETILVVEDEPALLNMCGEVLGRLGYNVLLASLPSQALKLAREHAGTIQLLMTDVVMPDMNGKELATRIELELPGIRCLYMSGYSAAAISQHGIIDEELAFLQKPFSRRVLADKVREVLEGHEGEGQ